MAKAGASAAGVLDAIDAAAPETDRVDTTASTPLSAAAAATWLAVLAPEATAAFFGSTTTGASGTDAMTEAEASAAVEAASATSAKAA
jgi:hypothetical protein